MLPKIIYGAKIKLIPFATSTEPIPIIMPAITTPHITAITLFLNPRSRILAQVFLSMRLCREEECLRKA